MLLPRLRQIWDLRFGAIEPRLSKGTVVVLCYHGVVESKSDLRLERNFHCASDFKNQIRFLTNQEVIPLSAIPDRRSDHKPAYAITFDDGYQNNCWAAEVLLGAGLPFTIFISTGPVSSRGLIWTVELSLLVLHGSASSIQIFGQRWLLNTRPQREAAFQAIRTRFKTLPSSIRQVEMQDIRAQFPHGNLDRLREQFPAFELLTWSQVRQLSAAGVEFGSHGVDHEIHHSAQGGATTERELAQSKRQIEAELDRPCDTFAFPNGDYSSDSERQLRAARYRMGFTMDRGAVMAGSSPFLLPRLSPAGSLAGFRQQLRGMCRNERNS